MAGGTSGESGLRDTGIAIQSERDLIMYFRVYGSSSDMNVSSFCLGQLTSGPVKRCQDFPQPFAN